MSLAHGPRCGERGCHSMRLASCRIHRCRIATHAACSGLSASRLHRRGLALARPEPDVSTQHRRGGERRPSSAASCPAPSCSSSTRARSSFARRMASCSVQPDEDRDDAGHRLRPGLADQADRHRHVDHGPGRAGQAAAERSGGAASAGVRRNGKEKITVEHLLLHTSGLIADNPLADYQDGRDEGAGAASTA